MKGEMARLHRSPTERPADEYVIRTRAQNILNTVNKNTLVVFKENFE